eukprot:1132458-Prorocentrum_lima.AAC.1
MPWVIAESDIEKFYIQVKWKVHSNTWYASPGWEYREKTQRHAWMWAPGTEPSYVQQPREEGPPMAHQA